MAENILFNVIFITFNLLMVRGQLEPCRTNSFVSVEECCNMPQSATKNAIQNCIGNNTAGAKRVADGYLQIYKSYNGYRGGNPNGPACLLQCVLEKQLLLKSDGELDESKLNAIWYRNADPIWRPILMESIKKCYSSIAKIDFSKIKKPNTGEKECKLKPSLYVTCVKQGLAVNCPNTMKSKDPKLIDLCQEKLTKLRSCNPLAVSHHDGGTQEIAMFQGSRRRSPKQKGYRRLRSTTTVTPINRNRARRPGIGRG